MPFDFLLTLLIAYLIGSINPAIELCRMKKLPDPRQHGSGNPGATNMYRIGGKKVAMSVLLFDLFKGLIPTWGSYHLGFSAMEIGFTAVSACFGHMFPIYYKFKGGKAVSTALGCMLPVGVSLGLGLLAIWLVVFKLTGYSSLAAIVSVSLSPALTYLIADKYVLPVSMLAILIVLRHTPNIIRLLNGTEPKSKQRL